VSDRHTRQTRRVTLAGVAFFVALVIALALYAIFN
jgi:hypothetical protein